MKSTLLSLFLMLGLVFTTSAQLQQLDFVRLLKPYKEETFVSAQVYFTAPQASDQVKVLRHDMKITGDMDISTSPNALFLGKRMFSFSRIYYAEVKETEAGLSLTLFVDNSRN